ncbi:hypothetical protein U2F10_24120 [Leptothoe sp. EHU-05/26/07-4]
MKRSLNRRIRKLWRDRLLLGMGSLLVLGVSALQLQAVVNNRPKYPSWALELFESVEILTKEQKTKQNEFRAILEIERISKTRGLQNTELAIQHLTNRPISLVILLDAQTGRPALSLIQPKVRGLANSLIRLENQTQVSIQTLAQVQKLIHAQSQAQFLAENLSKDLAQIQGMELGSDYSQSLAQFLAQDLFMVTIGVSLQDSILTRSQELAQELTQAQELAQIQELTQELAQELDRTNKTLLVFILAAELEKNHGLTLQQGNTLETLLSREPNRTHTFLQSGILLGASTLALFSFLVALSKLQGSSTLPHTTHLIAFLPEEYVAELGYLQRRLKKTNASPWQIQQRLTHEFLFLLWAYYIQVKLENLFLPFGDHTIDD